MHSTVIITKFYTLQFTSMEGNMKRKNQFKKGCTPWNKGISLQEYGPSQESQSVKLRPTVRINIDEFSLVTKASSSTVSLSTPDCESISNSVRLLRPIAPTASENKQRTQCKDKGGMRIIDNDRMAETWNSAFRDHSIASAECQVPDIQILKETKWGLCWKITLHCTKCNFTAPESKLYKEIEINKPSRAGLRPDAPREVSFGCWPLAARSR